MTVSVSSHFFVFDEEKNEEMKTLLNFLDLHQISYTWPEKIRDDHRYRPKEVGLRTEEAHGGFTAHMETEKDGKTVVPVFVGCQYSSEGWAGKVILFERLEDAEKFIRDFLSD